MKKQLIVLSFLIGAFSLWGMDEETIAQGSPTKPIEIFNNLVTDFFEENQNAEGKLNILKTIRTNFKNDIGSSKDIKIFLDGDSDQRFIENEDNIYSLFSIIYFIYYRVKKTDFEAFLQSFPNKICSIFQICFSNEEYLMVPECRIFFLVMLSRLFDHINKKLPNIVEKDDVLATVSVVGNYINKFGSQERMEITFDTIKNSMLSICRYIKEVNISTLPISEDGIPALPKQEIQPPDEFSTMNWQLAFLARMKKAGLEKYLENVDNAIEAKEPTQSQLLKKTKPVEGNLVKSVPTIWQTISKKITDAAGSFYMWLWRAYSQ